MKLGMLCCVSDLESRDKDETHSVHIINIDIQDNHEEATIGAFIIRDLITMVLTETLPSYICSALSLLSLYWHLP